MSEAPVTVTFRVGERPARHSDEPIGGLSPIDQTALWIALVGHAIEIERQRDTAAAKYLRELAMATDRPRESRMAGMAKREHLNIADATGRRHGRTYGPSRGGWIPVKWEDTGERENVREEDLLLRFTVQSVGYVPKSERDAKAAAAAAEEAEVLR